MRTSLVVAASGAAIVLGSTALGQSLSTRLQEVARIQQDPSQSTRAASKAQLLGALLYTDITVDFSETPVKEAFNYIRSQMGVDLVARYSNDKGATIGLNPEATVTLKVDARPALNVIEMVLDQVSDGEPSTWQLRDGFIEVGPKDRLDKARDIRYYPVRDLLFEPPHFDNAPEFDLDSAINQGNNGGAGGGTGGGGGGGGGFGGVGGGGGGGGSGGGGSGSGGTIFGNPGEDPKRKDETERADQLLQIIQETVEPERWVDNGGDAASIRYYQGVFIVRAPDYIQRQLGGYPFSARPPRPQASAAPAAGRYVTFNAPISVIQNVGFGTTTVTGAAGGGTGGNGGKGNGGGTGGGKP
ncbi:MAG: hypothetical protein U0575_05295 [Phycisphaerales bacterium]